jgi:GT2 family glycosyltransferase
LGAVSPVLYNSDGKIDYYYSFFPSLYSILMIQLGLYNTSKRIQKNMIEFMDSSILKGKPFYVEQAIGACILIRKTVIDKIGGFDETFFIYQEETDWEYRMYKKGWKVMIIPKAQAIHEHHSSTNKLGDIFVKHQWLRSLIIYYVKNFNLYKRTFLRVVMFFVLLSRGIKYFFSYLRVPKTLMKSECSMLKLLKLNFTPRKYLLRDRYVFGGFCI